MNEHLRQTGRTERMLANAISLCTQGRAVYIYTDSRGVRRLQDQLRNPAWSSIKVEVLPEDFNWTIMKPHDRAHPNCVFLVEHQLIELELQKLDERILRLQQLARQLYSLTT